MQLITSLQEASGHSVEDLKRVMSKDKRIKGIFGKSLELDDIENKPEFLNTVKFYLLNNKNVLDFVDGRNNVKSIDKATLKKLRELKPTQLVQRDIDNLLQFVSDLFREYSFVERSGMSPALRKEILDWVNANGRYFDLPMWAQRELITLPNIRPSRPTLLYRGLLFKGSDLKERKRYDGQLEVGKGLKFLRSVKEGSRVVELDWDRASSWTTSREVAMRFAQFDSAKSNFEATMNWLHNSSQGNKIHGDLGFVITTLAQPDDVLIDMSRLITSAHIKHGDEGEFILKPGTYTCRISTKFSKKGEVDPVESSKVDDSINGAVDAIRDFASKWDISEFDELSTEDFRSADPERMLRAGEIEKFVKLAQRSTKEKLLKVWGELLDFYKEYIAPLSPAQLETLVGNTAVGKYIDWLNTVRKTMDETQTHSAFKTPDNSKGRTKVGTLTPEQYRETAYGPLHTKVKQATQGGRYTDWGVGAAMNSLAKGFGGEHYPDIHRKGRKEQEEHTGNVMSSFFKAIGTDEPADREQATKVFQNAILAAERNSRLYNEVSHLRELLDDATKPAAE